MRITDVPSPRRDPVTRVEGVAAPKRRFTVDEYLRMGEAGILSEDERVELIRGEILEMTPVGSRHAACVRRLTRLFSRLGERALVSVQNPLRLSGVSLPQPDLALLKPEPSSYAGGHPGPEDALLVVEVAETFVSYDRDVKLPLYAEAGIAEAWLVDLTEGTIWVFRQPDQSRYADVRRVSRGDEVAPAAFPDLLLPAVEVLGRDVEKPAPPAEPS